MTATNWHRQRSDAEAEAERLGLEDWRMVETSFRLWTGEIERWYRAEDRKPIQLWVAKKPLEV